MANLSYAANGDSGYIYLNDKPIQIISGGDDSRVFIYNTQIVNTECTTPQIPVLFIGPNQVVGKELYSAVLTAKTAGKKVRLITNGYWLNQYPIIFSMFLDE